MSAPWGSVAIVGVYTTRMARSLGMTPLATCLEAALGALEDAGLERKDVDAIGGRWPGPGGTVLHPGSADWATLLDIPLRWIDDTYPQGVPGLLNASAAIAAGLCHTALIIGGQAAATDPGGPVASYTRPDNEFVAPWGAFTAVHFALVAQRYRARYKPDPESIAAIAAEVRNMGSRNPRALLHGKGPYTARDILEATPIVDPFTLLDLCLTNEGAAAVVVTSVERARNLRRPPVVILGGGAEWQGQQYVNPARFENAWMIGSDAARRAFETSGLGHDDIDFVQVYDATTYEIVRNYEALGFCDQGEGADFARQVGIGVEGGLPTNTDGGLLSFGHIGWGAPTLKIVEAVRQLRGEAGDLQVPDARYGIATGAGSGAQYSNVVILGRAS